MKKIWVLFLLACSAAAQTAPATNPSRTVSTTAVQPADRGDQPTAEQVQRFFELMHLKEQTQLLLNGAMESAKIGARQTLDVKAGNLSPSDRARLDRFMDETFNDLFKDLSVDELVAVSIPIYQKHLTKTDLDGLLAFYSSPVGQKLLKEMPAMTQEAMQAGAQLMQPKLAGMMERIEQRSNAMLKEIQAEHEQRSKKPAAPATKKN